MPNKRKETNIGKMIGNWCRYVKRTFCFDSHYQIDGDIIKDALKRVNMNRNDGSDIELMRNQISKIADSNDSIQHRIDSIEKAIKSIEKMLDVQNNRLHLISK